MQGRPDIQKTRARALLNRFKRGSQPHTFPSLINFNAFLGTIIADTESAFVHTGQRAAVCDCQLYFSKPYGNLNPRLPHHCLPAIIRVPTRLQLPALTCTVQDSSRDSTKEIPRM